MDNQFDRINFLASIIQQCPNNSVIELQCNWTSVHYSDEELKEIKGLKINSVRDCKTRRQEEVFKSSQLDSFKYAESKLGDFDIWNGGLNLFINTENKNPIIEQLKKYFDITDICHCVIYTQHKHIAKCYDSFNHNALDENIFKFSEEQKRKYAENDIDIYLEPLV